MIDINQQKLTKLENKLQKKYPNKVKSYCIDITDEKLVRENGKCVKDIIQKSSLLRLSVDYVNIYKLYNPLFQYFNLNAFVYSFGQ